MKKTAIILGASGLTGNLLLHQLIEDERYNCIKLFSRKKIEGLPSKVIQKVGNILTLENFAANFKADEVFCCIGTTAKKTPDKTLYKNIDYGIPVSAAKISKENNIKTFLVISSIGANPKSAVFYSKTKGEMEQEVLKQQIENTYILRPSIIGGNRNENRIGEKMGLFIIKTMQPLLIGSLKKYRMINAETIAKAMINLANSKTKNTQIITSNYIQKLAKRV